MRDTRDIVLRLYEIVSRMSREGGDLEEQATIAEAASYIAKVEASPAGISELDARRTAQVLLNQHGAQEAWRLLTTRALDEHLSNKLQMRAITLQIMAALHKLTAGPDDKTRH